MCSLRGREADHEGLMAGAECKSRTAETLVAMRESCSTLQVVLLRQREVDRVPLETGRKTMTGNVEVPVDRARTEYTGFEFQGAVAGISPATPIDDRQTMEITVRFDGTGFGRGLAGASEI